MNSNLWKWGGVLLMGWLAGCKPTEEPPAPWQRLSLSLVKDIDTSGDGLARPRQFRTVGNTTFFTASDEASGVELWKTDGTEAGTVRVKDVVPGPRTSDPWFLLSEGGNLFFSVQRNQLWKSDGTEAGTVLLNEDRSALSPWGNVANPNALWSSGGWVYFLSRNYPEDILFANDGRTPGGTQRVASFSQTVTGDRTQRSSLEGVAGSVNGALFLDVQLYDSSATPQHKRQLWPVKEGKSSTLQLDMPAPDSYPAPGAGYAVVGNTLFFVGRSSGVTELWRTDGTPSGTGRVKELVPYVLTAVGGMLFFVVRDDQGGLWLWKSDGTEAGTVPVKALPPSARYTRVAEVGGTLFFLLKEEASGLSLWKSDGTEAGTGWVKSLPRAPRELKIAGRQLFFLLDNGSLDGTELWSSDGTEAGTRLVKSFSSGRFPSELTAVGELLFFRFDDGATGQEVWRSDGTEAGTRLLKDLAPGVASSEPSALANANGTLLFTAQDDSTSPALWKSDGTEAGTVRVSAMQWPTRSAFSPNSTGESEPAFIHETLFFSTAKPNPAGNDWIIELWKSDGTREGTVPIPFATWSETRYHNTIPPTQSLGPLVNGTLFFQSLYGFWQTDGTEAGTARARQVLPVPDARIDWLRTLDTGAIFYVYRSSTGRSELWATNGAGPGGVLLLSPASGLVTPLASLDGSLLMLAPPPGSNEGPLELWRTDGTTAGTVRVTALEATRYGHIVQAQRAEDKMVFFIAQADGGLELWRTDGTEAGTVRLKSGLLNDLSHPLMLTEAGGRVFFATKSTEYGTGRVQNALWSTDGTVEGTVGVRVFEEGVPRVLTAHAGKLYFWTVPHDKGPPSLLWTSDGTEAGTLVLGSFARGGISGEGGCGKSWQSLNGALYFGADDGQTGMELWRTNGTPEGTVLVKDVVPGAESSGSRPLAAFADKLVFAASSADHPNTGKTWVSDGTAEGTVLLQEEETGRTPFAPCNAVQVGSRLFFQASTPGEGRELWRLESRTSP